LQLTLCNLIFSSFAPDRCPQEDLVGGWLGLD
jgi:hypothetical protein